MRQTHDNNVSVEIKFKKRDLELHLLLQQVLVSLCVFSYVRAPVSAVYIATYANYLYKLNRQEHQRHLRN